MSYLHLMHLYSCNVVATSPVTLVCLCPTQEVDEFFEQEKTFLLDYYSKIKDSTAKAEKMTRSHKSTTGFLHFQIVNFELSRMNLFLI